MSRPYRPRLKLTLKPNVDPADVLSHLSEVNHVKVGQLSDRKDKPGWVISLQFVTDIERGTLEGLLPFFRRIYGVESAAEDVPDAPPLAVMSAPYDRGQN